MSTLLVTGASGNLGRGVVEALLDAGGDDRIIATSRTPSSLDDLVARGVEVRHADFDAPDSLAPAFAGVDRLLLVSTDRLDTPDVRIPQHQAAVATAAAAGVKHVVYTSHVAALPGPSGVANDHFQTELAIFRSGMTFTLMRHSLYTDLLGMSVPAARASGQLFSATAGKGRSNVTRADCARADAAALRLAPENRVFLVTGPAAVTQAEIAALIGPGVAHVDLSPDALHGGLLAAGLPPFLVDALVAFDVEAAHGLHAVESRAVRDLTGQEPESVADYFARMAL
ncbi:KR domain-containing protein [Paroceanicella profunda]|uniref:KR domain-containing protein n=1 Tax=Paroceanicella profunda TaxID=2579971 RepID=A0A5B8FW33_9RHOB|nr:NAD(P)H-binding protein [Paroceanicella profunda]QDL91410.1 KR domain-containing protein [Paroceanicella profunda]